MTAEAGLADAAAWVPLLRAGRRLSTIPESTITWRRIGPIVREGEQLLSRIVAGEVLGQPEAQSAERLAEAYRAASPAQRRTILERGRDYVARLHAAVREQIRRLSVGGTTGAVLQSLRQSERELREALAPFAAAAGVGIGVILLIVVGGLWLAKGR